MPAPDCYKSCVCTSVVAGPRKSIAAKGCVYDVLILEKIFRASSL